MRKSTLVAVLLGLMIESPIGRSAELAHVVEQSPVAIRFLWTSAGSPSAISLLHQRRNRRSLSVSARR
jgi:hypothetical protein